METTERPTMARLLALAEDVFRAEWEDGKDEGDLIHDIADHLVPVYTADLLELALDDLSLATEEPEYGPAYDGRPTAFNILAANVYWRIVSHLLEKADALKAQVRGDDDE